MDCNSLRLLWLLRGPRKDRIIKGLRWHYHYCYFGDCHRSFTRSHDRGRKPLHTPDAFLRFTQ
jgi:hypothetical protein